MKQPMSKKKVVKLVIFLVIALALLAGLIYLMVIDQDYGSPDKLEIGGKNFGERLWIGIQVALLGMGIVFVVLIILILFVNLLRYLMEGVKKLGEKKAEKKVTKLPAPETVLQIEGNTEEEVVAVITAAIAAYYDAQEPVYMSNLKFRVRSIKEI